MKLYLTNSAASFTPTTIRGSWSDAGLTGVSALSPTKSGASATAARAETSTSNNWHTLLRRFVSEPMTNGRSLSPADTYVFVIGAKESSTAMDAVTKIAAYVTVGSSDALRGGVLFSHQWSTEWSSATNGSGNSDGYDLAGSADCQVGDRLVLEIGYKAQNTVATSYTGTLYYGGTGADLTENATTTTTNVGWFDLPGATDILFGPPVRSGSVTDTVTITAATVGAKQSGGSVTDPVSLAPQLSGLKTYSVIETVDLAEAGTGIHDAGPVAVLDTIGLTETVAVRHDSGVVSVLDTIGLAELTSARLLGSLLEPPPDVELLTAVYQPPTRRPLRFIAQSILSGVILDWDLPLVDPEITWTLSGPTMIRASIDPELPDVAELKLDAWSTMIHVESDGEIRASGIMQPILIEGESLAVEAVGVSAYPHELPFWGEISEIEIDPLEVVRRIWSHVQSFPDSHLGVIVDATSSPVRLGEPSVQEVDDNGQLVFVEEKDSEGNVTSREPKMTEAKPYVIAWYTDTDCGAEIDTLIKAVPCDYVERSVWNGDRTGVNHRIELGYPRVGRKRTDLRIALDENMLAAFPLREEPGQYASQVMVRGAGEGRDSVRGYAGVRSPARLRRVRTVTDRTLRNPTLANKLARAELSRAQAVLTIGEVVIDATHPNAPLGSFSVGDDVVVQGRIPYLGEIALWHRVIAYTWRPDTDTVALATRRSDQFAYGSPLVT